MEARCYDHKDLMNFKLVFKIHTVVQRKKKRQHILKEQQECVNHCAFFQKLVLLKKKKNIQTNLKKCFNPNENFTVCYERMTKNTPEPHE